MAYQSSHPLFRSLDDVEEAAFRAYAREHAPVAKDWAVTHPVCRQEWRRLGIAGELPCLPEEGTTPNGN